LIREAEEPQAARYLDYFPVAAIAALETVFRVAVRDLVDSGAPYSERAGAVVHDVKVEVPALHAFHVQKLTVGEFVAHLVPFKAFGDIDKALTTLLGSSLLDALKTVEDPWEKRVKGRTDARVLPDHGAAFEDVKALIAARHQIAHEVPYPSLITDAAVLRRQLASVEGFARGIEEVVSQMVTPNAPLTQSEMNEAAGARAREADGIMHRVYAGGLAGLDDDDKAPFEVSQRAFIDYRTKASAHAGSQVAGGSMQPMIEALEFERLTRQRTEDLERLLKPWEEPPGE
jgi:uncharacterized protein YecT (DUF1311 family)